MTISSEQIQSWLRDSALPLWGSAGHDSDHGGFYDELTLDGAPITERPKRLRVQARQVYVYSHAHLLGWQAPPNMPSPLELATSGFEFMTGHYWRDDPGGFVYSVDRAGEDGDATVGLYELAFALLAFAWFYRASADDNALTWAKRSLGFLDAEMADPAHGGYFDNLSRDLPRRQNPHMHLLEALLALHQAAGAGEALAHASTLISLFRDHFFDGVTGTLGEFFDAEWNQAEGTAGQIVEPGHHFEWVWLLHQYGAACGEDLSEEAAALYQFAVDHGIDHDPGPTEGLVFDSLLRRGVDLDDNKRLWGQTEALKAHTARLGFTGDEAARALLDAQLERLFDCHLLDETGLWREHLARDGAALRDSVPATSLYHLFLALSEVLRVRDGVTGL